MRLGLLTYNIARDWDLATLLSKCVELGYEGVELRTDSGHAHGVEATLSRAGRLEVKQRVDGSEVVLCGLGSGCTYDSPDAAKVKREIEHTKKLLELCCDLGAPGLKVFGNNFHEKEGIERSVTIAQMAKALRECARTANDVGVELRLEMHGDFYRPEDVLEVLHQADHPQIKLIYNCDGRDGVEGSVGGVLHEVMPYVTHVHMHELTHARYPYQEALELLTDSGYTGFCVAEIQQSAEPERLLGYYHDLWHAWVD